MQIIVKVSLNSFKIDTKRTLKGYHIIFAWWAKRGSNPRPSRCKRAALPLRHSPNVIDIYKLPGFCQETCF
jgi:hypothetical protein